MIDAMKLAECLMVMAHMEEDMPDVTDLNEFRNRNEKPDDVMVRHDDFGRPMYLFALEYEFEGGRWTAEVWAYSMEEAANRVSAMRQSLVLLGQMFTTVPG